jgi:predicted nucleic acid-binding protein
MKKWSVVDTNVVVSGVFGAGTNTPPRRILEAMLRGKVRFLVSESLVFEYRRVLLLPSIVQRHGLTEGRVDELLRTLLENAAVRKPEVGGAAASAAQEERPIPFIPGDEHIIDLLSVEWEAVLVTGDRLLADAVGNWREVLSPAAFAATIETGASAE